MLATRLLSRFALLVCLSSAAHSGCNRTSGSTVSAEAAPTSSPADSAVAKARPVGNPQPRLPTGDLDIVPGDGAPIRLRVEIATKPEERQQGLMFREHLAETEGMLFAFPTERVNNFWMHNTLIPLDMLFIDSEWSVVGIVENAEPLTDDARGVPQMSQYVLEVPGGFAARHRLGAGVKIKFVPPQTLEMP